MHLCESCWGGAQSVGDGANPVDCGAGTAWNGANMIDCGDIIFGDGAIIFGGEMGGLARKVA